MFARACDCPFAYQIKNCYESLTDGVIGRLQLSRMSCERIKNQSDGFFLGKIRAQIFSTNTHGSRQIASNLMDSGSDVTNRILLFADLFLVILSLQQSKMRHTFFTISQKRTILKPRTECQNQKNKYQAYKRNRIPKYVIFWSSDKLAVLQQ